MLPEWLVYYFWPMAKKPKAERQVRIGLHVRFVIRQVRLVLVNGLWLAGVVQDFCSGTHTLREVCTDPPGPSAQAADGRA